MKLSKKNENTVITILFVLIVMISLFIISLSIYSYITAPLEVKSYTTTFIVGENPGIDLNDTIITFGKVPRDGEAEKNLIIENTYNFPIEIKIFASKEIADYLYFEEEKLMVNPNSNIEFKLKLKIPADMEFGNYSGTILAKIYRVK
jgi:hypothetical protein